MDNNWAEQLKNFMNSPLGKEMVRTLKEDLRESLIREAEASTSQEKAYGLLKEAGGVIKSIDHLMAIAVMVRDKGTK